MNVAPTSGPIATSNTHQARAATSSRYSFAISHQREATAEGAEIAERNVFSAFSAFSPVFCVPSSEGKEHLFGVVGRRAAAGGVRRQRIGLPSPRTDPP